MNHVEEALTRAVEENATPVTLHEVRMRTSTRDTALPTKWQMSLGGIVAVLAVSLLIGLALDGRNTPSRPGSRSADGAARDVVVFTRETAQGVHLTFRVNARMPIVARVKQRLRNESAFEVKQGRAPIPARCFDLTGYADSAAYAGVSFQNTVAVPTSLVSHLSAEFHIATSPSPSRSEVIVVVARADLRVTSIELDAPRVRDAQNAVSGWALLAVVVPRQVATNQTQATLVARAKNGEVIARLSLPDQTGTGAVCAVPVQ